jgi:hypothetical protein
MSLDWVGWGDLTPNEQEAIKTYSLLFSSLLLNIWLVLQAMFRPGPGRKKTKKRGR